jgi:hypothetical protein
MLYLALNFLVLQYLLGFSELRKLARKLLGGYFGLSFSSEMARFTFKEFAAVMVTGLPRHER